MLKRKVNRQREENEALEAKVREQVVSEVMEVINDMQNGFRYVCSKKTSFKDVFKIPKSECCFFFWSDRETLEAQTALLEEKYEDKIANLQMHLKKFYSEELKVRASCNCSLFPTIMLCIKNNQSKIIHINFRRENGRLKICLLTLIK